MFTSRYIELILYKTYADIRAEAEKTYIGFLWWVIDPIIFMVIFYVVFGVLLERRTDDFIAFLLVGLGVWRWFQNTVNHGSNSILQNRNLMRQVYIPKIIFPIVTISTDLIKFLFVFILLLAYLWISGYPINIHYLALPIILITEFILIVACTCFVAAVVPFFPDVRLLVSHILQAAFFLSGIFYTSSQVPEAYRFYFYLNPMANIIEAYREVLMYNHWPDWQALTIISIISLVILVSCYRLLAHYDQIYPKIAN